MISVWKVVVFKSSAQKRQAPPRSTGAAGGQNLGLGPTWLHGPHRPCWEFLSKWSQVLGSSPQPQPHGTQLSTTVSWRQRGRKQTTGLSGGFLQGRHWGWGLGRQGARFQVTAWPSDPKPWLQFPHLHLKGNGSQGRGLDLRRYAGVGRWRTAWRRRR